ncbi:DsbA family oxidoreductase [Halobacillus sp. Marseille-P3879]|uniref:DsbA family oxidoreductase n=1 Tax=Halobacillus sp. Marseille-P3879 TaxID=2045014 RepID=UPI000C7BE740|nr:DsbA family oxidoreductase [Halobacillus sp. Marseille-P3879]
MRIEVWSDFVCPFCYIGKRRLEQALLSLPKEVKVELIYKSFELDPEASVHTGLTIEEKLAEKYGKSLSEVKDMTKHMEEQASETGLDFQFSRMVPTNTFNAHRIAKLADKYNLHEEINERLFKAVFTDGKNVGEINTLAEIASQAGLEADMVQEAVTSNSFAEKVRAEENEAYDIGVQGVPFL